MKRLLIRLRARDAYDQTDALARHTGRAKADVYRHVQRICAVAGTAEMNDYR